MAANAKGASDAVRRAVERTIDSTVGSGAQTRGRAQDLVDDVLRRAEKSAQRATRSVREVTDKQREAASGVGEKLVAAIQDMRLATGEDLRQLHATVERLDRRVARLEGSDGSAKATKKKAAKKKAATKKKAQKKGSTVKRKAAAKKTRSRAKPATAKRRRKR